MGAHQRVFGCLVLFLGFLAPGLVAAAQEHSRKVVATIKPLGLIVQALTEGSDIQVETLLPPGSSPHHYALKVSDARRLQGADLVVWLGREAEPYIASGKLKNSIALLDYIEENRLIEAEGEAQDHNGHRHGVDPHVWLDPVLAQEIAALIEKHLLVLYPDQIEQIEANTRLFRDKNTLIDQKLNKLLAPYQKSGFLVYHNAFEYFVRHYDLRQLGVVQARMGSSMSVKHLVELRRLIEPEQVICVFREPQFIKVPLPDIAEGHKIREGILDPLGMEARSYQELMENLANQLVSCFAGKEKK